MSERHNFAHELCKELKETLFQRA